MQIATTKSDLSSVINHWQYAQESIAFVPTMGNLHAGHLSLVDKAKQLAKHVVVSIFVNPMQFAPNEDFANYPRTLQEDQHLLTAHSVDLLFAPMIDDIYTTAQNLQTFIDIPILAHELEGFYRPYFFNGVATVVLKLFNLVRPQFAIFGQKDLQQVLIIKKMVHDLNVNVEIVQSATVREQDGLALSSRNQYLNATDRALAPLLYRTLCEVRDVIIVNPTTTHAAIVNGKEKLAAQGFIVDYLELRRAQDLSPATENDHELALLVAAKIGKTRLIDNLIFSK